MKTSVKKDVDGRPASTALFWKLKLSFDHLIGIIKHQNLSSNTKDIGFKNYPFSHVFYQGKIQKGAHDITRI